MAVSSVLYFPEMPSSQLTYLAGYVGSSGIDYGYGIADLRLRECVYNFGVSTSTEANFPVKVGPDLTHNGGTHDACVRKVNVMGSDLEYAGYIGSTKTRLQYISGIRG